jgi:hypothetical protein
MIAKRIRIPFEGEMLTFVEVAARVGLSPSRVATLHYQGRAIAKSSRMQRRRVEFDGKMLTAAEIAPLVGLKASTVRHRISAGLPLGPIKREYDTFEFRGEQRTVREIASALGRTPAFVRYRLDHSLPLEGPAKCGRKRRDPLLESGERKISTGAGENGLYWEDDLEARIWHLYCGGDDFGECTLDEIAQCWGLTRERIRQVEFEAREKIRARAKRGDKDALALQELLRARIELREQRGPSPWEQAALNAPGAIDLAGWERAHSMSELAKRSGREHDVDASAVESARRGNAAAVRTRMESRSA